MTTKHKELGERFKTARMEAGLSQKTLGEILGVTAQNISKIEQGLVKHPSDIDKLSVILGKSKEYLLFGTPEHELKNILSAKKKIPVISWQQAINLDKLALPLTEIQGVKFMLNFHDFGEHCFGLVIEDNIMSGHGSPKSFMEGDVIVIDPKKEPENGKYVIYEEPGASKPGFKQYIVDGSRSFLKPINPQYPAIPVDASIKITGVVVAHVDVKL